VVYFFQKGDEALNGDQRNYAKIEQEDITVLQEEVKVQFDNRQQTPLGFVWRKKHYEVLQLLQTKKELAGRSVTWC
jgi:hypothetical protein